LKRLVLLSLFLALLVILIPSCITVQQPAGQPPVIGTFSSNPSAIDPSGMANLSWNVTGANSVSIDQGIGLVSASGTRQVSPATSTVYTLSATNSKGTVTRTALTAVNTVSSNPVRTSFSVTGITLFTEPSPTGCANLSAYITADGPGTATYNWESTNGTGYSYAGNTTFSAAGIQKITIPVGMGALPSGPYQVHVLTPNDLVSNTIYYSACGL